MNRFATSDWLNRLLTAFVLALFVYCVLNLVSVIDGPNWILLAGLLIMYSAIYGPRLWAKHRGDDPDLSRR